MMKPGRVWGLVVVALLGLAGCQVPVTPPPEAATATPVPPSPTASATPAPTATPSPFPTPDAAPLVAVAEEGTAQVTTLPGGARPLCLHYEDTDGDTIPEWLAVVHQPEPVSQLSAFVLDGEVIHALPAAQPEPGKPDWGLGQYAACEVEIRDVNADGRAEIAIFGHAEQNETLLHLYVWEADAYRLLGAFRGTAGVTFEDADGDLAEEIIEGHRDTGASDLAWDVIFTWDGQTYGWTADRWDWFFLERPHAYPTYKPEYAVISFYLALDDRDLPGAYALMTGDAQAVRPYEAWAQGFDRTLRVDAGSVHRIPDVGDESHARVATLVTSWDNEDGRVLVRSWDIEWETVLTPDGWRLNGGTMDLLTTWEAPFWE